ncbi:hypothetical protein ACRAWG_28775 [Methylobacterium sp. P31]
MTRRLLRNIALALGLSAVPALAQQSPRPQGRATPEKGSQDKGAPDRHGGPPVIGCPSLANYRMLMRGGAQAAAAQLADPKADHLGCTALSRTEITGIVDRVTLGGQSYDCAGVRGTTACHWIEAGAAAHPAPAGR